MTNFQMPQVNAIDVPVTVNGRKANAKTLPERLSVVFGKAATATSIPLNNIRHVALLPNKIGIVLQCSQCVLPRTTKPVDSFVLGPCNDDDAWQDTVSYFTGMTDAVNCCHSSVALSTVCGRSDVYFTTAGIAVWQKQKCNVVRDLKAAILQRTTGGMATYDVHIVPATGNIVTVEMLPHSTLDAWDAMIGSARVADAGADPLDASYVQHAQTVPCVKEFIENVVADMATHTDSSDAESEWNSSDCSSSGTSSSCEDAYSSCDSDS